MTIRGMLIIFLHMLNVFELSICFPVYDIEGIEILALPARCLVLDMHDDIVIVLNSRH